MKMYGLLVAMMILFLVKSQSQFLELNATKNIDYRLVVGDNKFQEIQEYFTANQQCEIQMLNHQQNKSTNICEVFKISQNHLQTFSLHFFYVYDDYRRYSQVLYKYQDVLHLKNALDMVLFQSNIIVLFQHGDAVYYKMKTQDIVQINRISLNTNIDEGNFLVIKNQCLYFSKNKVYRLYSNGSFSEVKGYEPSTHEFELAKAYGSDKVAILGKGVAHYEVQENQLKMMGSQKIVGTNDKNQQFEIQVIDMEYDLTTKTFYYLDDNEGLFSAKQGQKIDQKVVALSTGFDEDSCENLVWHDGFLFMTCPNLFQYDPITKNTTVCLDKVQVVANQILINNSKLYLIGQRNYVIYDTARKKVQYGTLPEFITKMLIFQHFYIGINDFLITVNAYSYAKWGLYCGSSEASKGVNTGILSVKGECIDYQTPILGAKTQCKVKIPISVQVYVPENKWHILQIVGIIVIIWLIVSGSIWYCVKNIQVHKQYNRLVEEGEPESRNQDIGK